MEGYDNHTIAKPTWFKPNDVTAVFQSIVDTYGVPSYLEANPAVVSTVTFPFLFGMMFGDMGHGSILAFGGIVLVLFHNRLKEGGFDALMLWGRYLFMLMGLFACYCGLIYNEFFAMKMNLFDSCYRLDHRVTGPEDSAKLADGSVSLKAAEKHYYFPRYGHSCNYPMGMDPVWGIASNE